MPGSAYSLLNVSPSSLQRIITYVPLLYFEVTRYAPIHPRLLYSPVSLLLFQAADKHGPSEQQYGAPASFAQNGAEASARRSGLCREVMGKLLLSC